MHSPLTPLNAVTVITAVPAFLVVITPLELTDATDVLLEEYVLLNDAAPLLT